MLIFDKDICNDNNYFPMICKALKDVLLLVHHYGGQKTAPVTIGICSMVVNEGGVDIQPILSPIVPASSTLAEVFASLNLMVPNEDTVTLRDISESVIVIDWDSFIVSLMPHILYPPQEGFKISLISKRTIDLNGWIQQPNCLCFQIVQADNINPISENIPVLKNAFKREKTAEGLENINVSPLISEWDAFFKSCVFDQALTPSISVVIHFSTSIYSKLIICCNAYLRCLDLNAYNGGMVLFGPSNSTDEYKYVVETVSRVKKSGICQSLIGSQSIYLTPQMDNCHSGKLENQLRFATTLKSLHNSDSVLIVRTVPANNEKMSIMKRLFVLVPQVDEGYFLMLQIAPAELMLPDINYEAPKEHNENDDEYDLSVQLEVESAMKKISFEDYYDPFEHSCGIINAIQAQNSKIRGKVDAKKTTKAVRGRGRQRGGGSGSKNIDGIKKYMPIAKSVKN